MKVKTPTQEVPQHDLWYSIYSLVPVALAAISSNIKKISFLIDTIGTSEIFMQAGCIFSSDAI